MTNQGKTLRIGIVGCGMIANFHAHAIANTPGAVLAGACSRSRSSAEKFCAGQGITMFESYAAMLESPQIDAVSLCTPSGDHCGQILQALDSGKHVVVEKPMCISLADADEVIRLAEETGKKVCVISQLRFSDAIREIRRAIREGLTPCQRETILAYYIQDKRIPEIARERGVHKSSVSRALKRAENTLRRFLKY